MKLDKDELMKLFDFILENKDIIISDDSLFSRDTLIKIRAIIKDKIPNDFVLTEEQEKIIIDTFINSNNVFNEDTPYFILDNPTCITCSIKRDINSVNFLREVDFDIKSTIIDEVLKSKYILSVRTPLFLRKNISVILNSIMYDVNSADYIEWDYIVESDRDKLINEIIKSGYKLSYTSSSYLSNNLKLVMNSLKDNMDNIRFVGASVKNEPCVFKYMLLNGYRYNYDTIANKYLKEITDNEVFSKCLERMFDDNSKKIDDFSEICCAAFKNIPTIKMFDSVFEYVVDEKWKDYRSENLDKFGNVFGKICAELKNNRFFDKAIENIEIISELESVLDEKYDVLYSAMNEYFNIYHSAIPNKLEKIQSSKNIIAKLSALYVAKSKGYYKKSKLEELYDYIAQYFILRLENPYINKRIIEHRKKQLFANRYYMGDYAVNDFLDKIIKKYGNDCGYYTETMINRFVNGYSQLEEFKSCPYKYEEYEKYEKSIKLINRLNKGYIEYNSLEVKNYKDIISFNDDKEKYVYCGISFTDEEVEEINNYKKYKSIFNKIKKDIMLKIQSIEYDGEVDDDYLDKFASDLPFTDEYFKFDVNILNNITLSMFINNIMPEVKGFHFGELAYKNAYNLLVNNGLIWLLIFEAKEYNYKLSDAGINRRDINCLIRNMNKITSIANDFNFNLTSYKDIVLAANINEKADRESLAILGKDIIEKLYKDMSYTNRDEIEIINMAKRMVCQMVKRNKSTVPYISGKMMNYNYSLYDSHDFSVLLSGINTDSCFRIDGNDNDFFHYCALDKNGFVIKITDYYGEFVAKASGFRNGNCVFINQLRTIYDVGGDSEEYNDNNEIEEIIETFIKACEDIVETSRDNTQEINKIDYVFVTKSYCLCNYIANVSDDIEEIIGDSPMDTDSDDWENFVKYTPDLNWENYFDTDYGDYSLICIASSKKDGNIEIGDIKTKDIKLKDVPAVYERKRNKIMVSNIYDGIIQEKVNRIAAINSSLKEIDFTPIKIGNNFNVFVGDNWYIIYNDGNITDSCLLDFDNKAKIEFLATKAVILKYGLEYNKEFNNDEISKILYSDDFKNKVKILELK